MALNDMLGTLGSLLRNAAPGFPSQGAPPRTAEDEQFPGLWDVYWQTAWPRDEVELHLVKAPALVAVVYSCVTRLSDDLAALPLQFNLVESQTHDQLPPNDPMVRLWRRPSRGVSGFEFMRDTAGALLSTGNVYIYMKWYDGNPFSGRLPDELHMVPGHFIRPVPGPNRTVRGYWYEPKNVMIEPQFIMHVKMWNPNWDVLLPSPIGMSPLSAARFEWETRFHMGKWQRSLYKRGGAINHIFSDRTPEGLSPDEARAMSKELAKRMKSSMDDATPLVVTNLEVLQRAVSPRDMMFLEASNQTDVSVCNIYKVPPLMVGIRSSGLGSQAGADTDFLLYDTGGLGPVATLMQETITAAFCDRFAPHVQCELSMGNRLAMQKALLSQAEGAVKASGRYPWTLAEVRRRQGMPPAPEDARPDEFMVTPGARTMTQVAQDEAPAPEPTMTLPLRRNGLRAGRQSWLARRARMGRKLRRYEAQMERWARRYFARQKDAVLARAATHPGLADAALSAANVAALGYGDDLLPQATDEAFEAAQQIYEDIMAERGAEAGDEVDRDVALEVHRGRLGALIEKRSHDMIANIDHTTAEALNRTLHDFVANMESFTFEDLVREVEHVFAGRANNAETIARTETAWAFNTASWEAWKESDVRWKSWATLNDSAVRESHADCEAEGIIDYNARFSNGLRYPNDPDGDADEVCNCRCVLMPEFSPSGDVDGEDTDEDQSLGRAPVVPADARSTSMLAEALGVGS